MSTLGMLQFALARGIGDGTLKRASAYVQAHGITWYTFVSDPASMMDFGLSATRAQSVLDARAQALSLHEEMASKNVRIIAEDEDDYPEHVNDPATE